LVTAIDRLIELDEQESATQHERVAFLTLMEAVIEALPDGLVVTDEDGKVTLFNERAEFMFGRHRSEVIGQSVEFLMPERIRGLHVTQRQLYNRFDLSPHARTMGMGMQLTGIRSDGHEFLADITLARMVVPKGVYNLALVRYSRRPRGFAAVDGVAPGWKPEAEPDQEASDARS
jgi:two-component system sensor kinase FixL